MRGTSDSSKEVTKTTYPSDCNIALAKIIEKIKNEELKTKESIRKRL